MENLNKAKITHLEVFDFDGTLMDTLDPDRGKPIYKDKTGNDWPFKGWWGRNESLDLNIFDFEPIADTITGYNAVKDDEAVMRIMLTGRRPKLGGSVKAILDAKGLTFHRYMYNYGSDTLSNKIEQMGKLLEEFPNLRSIKQWDDRDEHVPTFKQWGKQLVDKGRLDNFEFVHVPNPNWTK